MLAAFSVLAIWLDPLMPSKQLEAAYTLLGIYLIYAVLLVPVAWSPRDSLGRFGLATHAFDLLVFTLLMYHTEGPTSPFFVFFIFSILCATARWQWRGTLWTAVAVLWLYLGLGIYASAPLNEQVFELNRFLIRGALLIVAAMLLGYMSAYEQRLRGELALLANWPRDVPRESVIQQVLKNSAAIFQAPRVMMIWEEPDEPWCYVATLFQGEFHLTRESPAAFEPLVAESLNGSNFFRTDALGVHPVRWHAGAGGLRSWRGIPLNADLEAQFAIGSVLSLVLRGETLSGRLFILDKEDLTADNLTLGGIVARQVTADMDQWYLQRRLQQAAAADERVRLARDLHDGLLQSLTGINLQLAILSRQLETCPETAQERLADIQALLTAEQRELRFFVQQLKPASRSSLEEDFTLAGRLDELRTKIARHWGLEIELHSVELEVRIPNELVHEVYRLVQEALVNAARHASASAVQVEVRTENNTLNIVVEDNGSGFPFKGRYDLARLNAQKKGPVSLKGRVASLRGDLIIDSSESGTRLEITVPLAQDDRQLMYSAG